MAVNDNGLLVLHALQVLDARGAITPDWGVPKYEIVEEAARILNVDQFLEGFHERVEDGLHYLVEAEVVLPPNAPWGSAATAFSFQPGSASLIEELLGRDVPEFGPDWLDGARSRNSSLAKRTT